MRRLWSVTLVGLLGCGGGPVDSGPPALDCSFDPSDASALDLEGRADCGAERYAEDCAVCHGADGLGTETGPDLSMHVPFHSDAEVLVVLTVGPGEMPALGLENQEAADVIAHLREWFPYDPTGTHPTMR